MPLPCSLLNILLAVDTTVVHINNSKKNSVNIERSVWHSKKKLAVGRLIAKDIQIDF